MALISCSRWYVAKETSRRIQPEALPAGGGVVDGEAAFCGGINILDDFHDPNHGALASPRLDSEASRLAKRAIRHKMASAGVFIRYAHAGGLLARGPSLPDTFRRAAAMVDRVLRGARVADIAVERPPRFELVINLKTAAALELTLPSVLMSASQHIVR